MLLIFGLLIAGIFAAAVRGTYSPRVGDGLLNLSLALPNAGGGTVTSASLDTGQTTAMGTATGDLEFLLTAPALNTTQLPDGETATYQIVMADDSGLTVNATQLFGQAILQTGAAGSGAALATVRFRLPSTAQRYFGMAVVVSGGAGDCRAASATLQGLQ
jgi:hypothetical protein